MKKIFNSVAAVKRYYKSGKTAYHLNCTELARKLLNAAYSYGMYGHAKYWVYQDALRMEQSHRKDFWTVIDRGMSHPEFRENTIVAVTNRIVSFTITKREVKIWDPERQKRVAVVMKGPCYLGGVYVVIGEEDEHFNSTKRSDVIRVIKNACCRSSALSQIQYILDWDMECDRLDESLAALCGDGDCDDWTSDGDCDDGTGDDNPL